MRSKFIKFLISNLKWQINSSSNFASFLTVMTHSSSVNFKLIHFLLWTKGLYQSPNFDIFECSGKNLLNSSCHFSNHKWVFLQILHHSSVSWKITLLYFFSSNIIYFGLMEPIESANFGDFWVLGSKFVKFLMSSLNDKSISLQFLYHSSLLWYITPL